MRRNRAIKQGAGTLSSLVPYEGSLVEYQGCNKPFKQKEAKTFLLKNKVDVCALLETRVKVGKFEKISAKIFKGWSVIHNYTHAPNGRIWVAWNIRTVNVVLVSTCAQGICCQVTDLCTSESFYFIAVYAYNTLDERKGLWDFMTAICSQITSPMCFGGDFNTVLLSDDRKNGNPVTQGEVKDFEECLQQNGLAEVRAIGSYYTWCNNQDGDDMILYKLDRVVANNSWLLAYPSTTVEVLEKGVSDHCPLLVNFSQVNVHRTTPIRFLNVLTEHEQFYDVVQSVWGHDVCNNPLINIWHKLKRSKEPLKTINAQHFKKIPRRIEQIRDDLTVVQHQLIVDSFNASLILQERLMLPVGEVERNRGENLATKISGYLD